MRWRRRAKKVATAFPDSVKKQKKKTYLDGPIVFFINICLSIVLFILHVQCGRVRRTTGLHRRIGLILVVFLQKVCLLFLFLHDFLFVRFPHHKLEKKDGRLVMTLS